MKIAVFFPGIGYHCDKPLLYYSGKIAEQQRYELRRLSYTGLHKQTEELGQLIEESFEQAYEQTEGALSDFSYPKVLVQSLRLHMPGGMESDAGMYIIRRLRGLLILLLSPESFFMRRMTRGLRRRSLRRNAGSITCRYIL